MVDIKRQIIEQCANDLIYFGHIINPQACWAETPQFHREIGEIFINQNNRKVLIEAPRGAAKSTLSIWAAIHQYIFSEGDDVIVIQSKTYAEALKRLRKIKNIIEYNDIYKELFGYHGEEAAEIWRENYIIFPFYDKRVTIYALGTRQQVRGILENDTRLTLYIVDDPEDENNTLTAEQMTKNYENFTAGLNSLDVRKGRVLVIGTPIKQGCMVERIKEMSDKVNDWIVRVYEAYDGTPDKLLWPEMWSYEFLENKRKEFEAAGMLGKFYADYRCNVYMDKDAFFKPNRFYEGNLEESEYGWVLNITHEGLTKDKLEKLTEIKRVPVNIFIGIDPATSVSDYADYSVIMPIAYDGHNIYILPYFRKRVPPTVLKESIIHYIKMYKPLRVHIEANGAQEAIRDELHKALIQENLLVSGIEKKIVNRGEKAERLSALHKYFYYNNIYIMPSMNELYEELIFFPRAKHDDTLDALFLAQLKLIAPTHSAEQTNQPVILKSQKSQIINSWLEAV